MYTVCKKISLTVFLRFTLLTKTGSPCTALAFNLCRKNEVLVASGDCSLRCYDSGTYVNSVGDSLILISIFPHLYLMLRRLCPFEWEHDIFSWIF